MYETRTAGLRRRERTGFSLVELLIVLSVVGILSAVAAPALLNMYSGSDAQTLENSAYELYAFYHEARRYAASHTREIAVVYLLSKNEFLVNRGASYGPQNGYVIRGMALAFKLTTEDFGGRSVRDQLDLPSCADGAYVLLPDAGGQFRYMKSETCVFLGLDDQLLETTGKEKEMHAIVLYRADEVLDPEGNVRRDRDVRWVPLTMPLKLQPYSGCTDFAAHVFDPSGRMLLPSDSLFTAQRLKLQVAPLPDPSLDADMTVDVPDSGGRPVLRGVPPVELHLYPATGRVKIVT